MFCTKCGAEIQLPARFCSKCGNPVEEVSSPVSGQASAAPNPASVSPVQRQNPGGAPVQRAAAPNPAPVTPVQRQNPGGAPVQRAAAPNSAQVTPVQRQNPNPAAAASNGTRGVPVPPMAASAQQAPAKPKGKVVYGANTLVGILGAFAVFLSMFLPCATAKVGAFGLSIEADSVSFIELMREGDAAFVSIVVLAGIGLAVLFQMVKCPKVSLVGVLAMLFGMGILVYAIMETRSGASGWASISFGIGFWLYLAGMVLCIVGAFLKKNWL